MIGPISKYRIFSQKYGYRAFAFWKKLVFLGNVDLWITSKAIPLICFIWISWPLEMLIYGSPKGNAKPDGPSQKFSRFFCVCRDTTKKQTMQSTSFVTNKFVDHLELTVLETYYLLFLKLSSQKRL